MNKLSDDSKDSIVRSLKTLFDTHSVTVCSFILKDCIMAACANPTQLMSSLIPIFSAIVAALHFTVGVEVGAFIVETLATSLHKAIQSATNNDKGNDRHSLISDKLPSNSLLLLVYLYNLRVLHHTLIVDIMTFLTDAAAGGEGGGNGGFTELRVELLEVLINHCGHSIRSDDPVSLKLVIATLTKRFSFLLEASGSDGSSDNVDMSNRLRFMLEALTDLKNNKSRRIQTAHAEVVKRLRKWLGSLKTSLPRKAGAAAAGVDSCLRVSLKDLLDADKRGRCILLSPLNQR